LNFLHRGDLAHPRNIGIIALENVLLQPTSIGAAFNVLAPSCRRTIIARKNLAKVTGIDVRTLVLSHTEAGY
jgi:hypothetical protein